MGAYGPSIQDLIDMHQITQPLFSRTQSLVLDQGTLGPGLKYIRVFGQAEQYLEAQRFTGAYARGTCYFCCEADSVERSFLGSQV